MKKFKYNQVHAPQPDGVHTKTRLYNIYLAPGVRRYFSSYKSAQTFANEYSRQVTQSLHAFNMLLGNLYTAHRAAWFYYYDEPSSTNHTLVENRIQNFIGTAELWIHRAVFNTNGHYTGGSVSNHLASISDALVNGFVELSAFLYARKLYAEAERLKIYAGQAGAEFDRISDMYYKQGD